MNKSTFLARLKFPWLAARRVETGERAGWQIERHAAVDSTQNRARKLEPWHAVVAGMQRLGQGTRDRTFTSDEGGLYLSAVLPYDGDARRWHGFALAIGYAIRARLKRLGVSGLRLRWPNDLILADRKVGGILVEQSAPDRLLVGLGLNVTNRPWVEAPELDGVATRLADHVERVPSVDDLEACVLDAIRAAHRIFAKKGFAGFVPWLNRTWGEPRPVAIEMAFGVVTGDFLGLESDGALRVQVGSGVLVIGAHRVDRLREIAADQRSALPGMGPIVDWNQNQFVAA